MCILEKFLTGCFLLSRFDWLIFVTQLVAKGINQLKFKAQQL
jgi:hypothetical protein